MRQSREHVFQNHLYAYLACAPPTWCESISYCSLGGALHRISLETTEAQIPHYTFLPRHLRCVPSRHEARVEDRTPSFAAESHLPKCAGNNGVTLPCGGSLFPCLQPAELSPASASLVRGHDLLSCCRAPRQHHPSGRWSRSAAGLFRAFT